MHKIIHQIWVGDKRIPKHIKENINNMSKIEGYTHILWTDENKPTMPDKLEMVYDSHKDFAIKADVLRLWLVYLYGGFYFDADFVLKKPIDFNLEASDALIAYHNTNGKKVEDLPNSFFYANKESKLFAYLINDIQRERQWVGPNWFAQKICNYVNLQYDTTHSEELIQKLQNNNVKTINWDLFNKEYAQHVALASWYPNSEWNIKFKNNNYD
jgi:mannosyltransferase OCH1-like enzyme